ncbi:MAG TPA: XRE family transcriptional regulator [Blastocatellia bacterium]|nr:XRE family transcriptional regulator [Blastocatellia bacterium]
MEKHILDQMDPKVLGARLQEARKARGMTQQAVADEMEMARTTLVAIEKGERRVSPQELIKLAALYGRPVSEFVSRQIVTASFVPQFRAEWKGDFERSEDIEKAGDELQRLAEDYVELERLCGLPMAKAYPPIYETSGSAPEQAAEETAAAERNRLGIGDGPISNLRDRLETDAGLRIFYFAMPPKVSGVFAYNDVLGGCVGINANHPRDRRNWSLAHEYGHFLTNRYRAEITFLSERRRQSAWERFADTFAENFLMPASGINRRFTELYRSNPNGQITLAQLCNLADLYQVSVQALIIRLEKLRRLTAGTWDRLESEGFKPRRAQQLLGIDANPAEQYLLPRRYLNLAVMAYKKALLSEGQLARFLRSDRVSARVLVEELSHHFNAEAEEGGYESFELDLAQTVPGR